MRVSNKTIMYELLNSGKLGNTSFSWSSYHQWLQDPSQAKYTWFGVRSKARSNDTRTKLWIHRDDLEKHCLTFKDEPYNISVMVDAVTQKTAEIDVWDSPTGIVIDYVKCSGEQVDRRRLMLNPDRHSGTMAMMLLRRHLNENSFDDLMILIENYPEQVVEISAFEDCFGTVPHRNAIVWEVRDY